MSDTKSDVSMESVPHPDARVRETIWLSKVARDKAYSPYSKFKVGAAVLCKDGTIITGCNVENASYGLSICAERTAIVKAVSEGKTEFTAIAVSSLLDDYIRPCGACRQFIIEFGSSIDVYCTKQDLTFVKETSAELLPNCFNSTDLDRLSSGQ
ncbi:Uncharacterised protein g3731 [Pycnogonum litorale]